MTCKIARCNVGPAVYQVGRYSLSHDRNALGSKPAVEITLPPADNCTTELNNPCKWNSGIKLRKRSSAVSLRVLPVFAAIARKLEWVKGTIRAFPVVADVFKSKATRSSSG